MEQVKTSGYSTWSRRILRYGPVIGWLSFIFFASTNSFSASNTSRLMRPLLYWLCPACTEIQIVFWHGLLRKAGHFTEYGLLAFLAARALATSSLRELRQHWFSLALLLIAFYALSDEYHQSYVPTRTASLYDSLIDFAGGLTVLLLLLVFRYPRKGAKNSYDPR